jgi:hypothetical protein
MLHIGVGRYRSSGGHLCSEINPSSMRSNQPLPASGLRLLAKSNACTRGETPAPGEGTLDASLIQGGLYGNRISLASSHRQTNRPASLCHELLTGAHRPPFQFPAVPSYGTPSWARSSSRSSTEDKRCRYRRNVMAGAFWPRRSLLPKRRLTGTGHILTNGAYTTK